MGTSTWIDCKLRSLGQYSKGGRWDFQEMKLPLNPKPETLNPKRFRALGLSVAAAVAAVSTKGVEAMRRTDGAAPAGGHLRAKQSQELLSP